MNRLTRRTFLKNTAVVTAGAALSARSWGQVAGANGDIDLNTATNEVEVIVMTNQGLMANLNIEGTKVTKLKSR